MSSGQDIPPPPSPGLATGAGWLPRASPWRRSLLVGQNLLGAIIVVGFAHHLWQRRAHFESVSSVSVGHIAALAGVIIVTWTISAAQNGLLYRASGVRMGFVENWLLTLGSGFASYLPLLAGTVVRVHYMKSVHGLRYARSGSISWLRTLLVTLSTGLLGLIGTLTLALTGKPLSPALLILFGSMFVFPLVAFCWPAPRGAPEGPLLGMIYHDFMAGLSILRRQHRTSASVLLLILLQQLCLGVRFFIAAQATGQAASLPLLCILAPLAVFASFISITPGALGLREGVMGAATYAAGAQFQSGLYVGTLDRAVLLGMVGTFGGMSLTYLWLRIRRAGAREAAKSIHATTSS